MFGRLFSGLIRRYQSQKTLHIATIKISDDGIDFVYHNGEKQDSLRWEHVEEIQSFKVDCFAYDSICLCFSTTTKSYVFDEEDIGFVELTEKIRQRFQGIPEDWYSEVMLPPFDENKRVLWKRDD